jgi:hypothetical protein
MGLHRCPKCGIQTFTWSIDEDVSALTQWHCTMCPYAAEEDESLERACDACGGGEGWLRDGDRSYRFCFDCGKVGAG